MTDSFRSAASSPSSNPNLGKLGPGLIYRTAGGRDVYPVYVILDARCQGTSRTAHESVFRAMGLTWQAGDWQPGETGGWVGEVDWPYLCQLTNLRGVQMVWKWLKPTEPSRTFASEAEYRSSNLNTRKVDSRVGSRTTSGPGIYPVYVTLDPQCQGSARSEHEAMLRYMGLSWQAGDWQPGETGGWAGEVDFHNLCQLSHLGGVQMVWRWLKS